MSRYVAVLAPIDKTKVLAPAKDACFNCSLAAMRGITEIDEHHRDHRLNQRLIEVFFPK